MNVVTDMENQMKILIPEGELKDLIADYLREQLPDKAGEVFNVNLTATRGPDGHCAEIAIEKKGTTPAAQEEAAPAVEDVEEEPGDSDEPAIDPFDFDDSDS